VPTLEVNAEQELLSGRRARLALSPERRESRRDGSFRKEDSETTLLQLIGGLSIAVHKVEPVALVSDPLFRRSRVDEGSGGALGTAGFAVGMLVHDPSGAEGALAFLGEALTGLPLDLPNERLSLLLAFRGGEFCPAG
jgi:hypothetical protein